MRTVTQRDALAPALKHAVRLVPDRMTIPLLTSVKIETGSDGLRATTCNLDSWFTTMIDSEPREPWSGCVAAPGLEAFVASVASCAEIALEADNVRLTAASSGATAHFGLMESADEFPIMSATWTAEPMASFEIEPDELAAALKFVEPTAADSGTRYHLQGAFIDPEERLVTTDGNRLAAYVLPVTLPAIPDNVIVPLSILRLLPPLLRGFASTVTVAITPCAITFDTGGWTLTSKLIDGTYPTWRRVIPERLAQPMVVEAKALRRAADRIATVCSSLKTRAARLRLDGGELSVTAVTGGGDTAEVTSVIAVQGGAEGLEIGLLAKYLIEALDVIDAEFVELHVHDRTTVAWLCAVGKDETGIAIMPMRV
jgi:DNA polymerase-3 subunit beta